MRFQIYDFKDLFSQISFFFLLFVWHSPHFSSIFPFIFSLSFFPFVLFSSLSLFCHSSFRCCVPYSLPFLIFSSFSLFSLFSLFSYSFCLRLYSLFILTLFLFSFSLFHHYSLNSSPILFFPFLKFFSILFSTLWHFSSILPYSF